MTAISGIVSAEAVIHGVLKIVWADGYEGVVDIRPVISKGRIFSYLANDIHFRNVQLGEYGHCLFWEDEQGNIIDFGAGALREKAEKQTALHALAS